VTDPDYPSLEQAYMDALIGTRPPDLMVARGDWILPHRPDLPLDPKTLYSVTKDEIAEVAARKQVAA
jgi:hypothetical protein